MRHSYCIPTKRKLIWNITTELLGALASFTLGLLLFIIILTFPI